MYSTLEKLKETFGTIESLILQEVEDAELTAIMTDTSEIMDSYLKTVLTLPLTEENALINSICLRISKTECYRRFARNDLPEDVREQNKRAFKDLEKIQQKKIIIQTTEENTEVNFEVKDTYFTNWI